MRIAPKESATKFRLKTKRRGLNGQMWVVVKNKNGTKRWAPQGIKPFNLYGVWVTYEYRSTIMNAIVQISSTHVEVRTQGNQHVPPLHNKTIRRKLSQVQADFDGSYIDLDFRYNARRYRLSKCLTAKQIKTFKMLLPKFAKPTASFRNYYLTPEKLPHHPLGELVVMTEGRLKRMGPGKLAIAWGTVNLEPAVFDYAQMTKSKKRNKQVVYVDGIITDTKHTYEDILYVYNGEVVWGGSGHPVYLVKKWRSGVKRPKGKDVRLYR